MATLFYMRMLLYRALGNIALVFSAILVCNGAYSAPADRDSESALYGSSIAF